MATVSESQRANNKINRFVWVEYIKVIALFWIFAVHVAERIFGSEFIAKPNSAWPLPGKRIAQLAPLDGFGLLDIPLNLFHYMGWLGNQGVPFFLFFICI